MTSSFFNCRLLFVLFPFLLSSCVAKKKHLEALQTLETEHQNTLRQKTAEWTGQLEIANANIDDLRLQVAERKGENNALVAMQDKLEGRIEDLKRDLKNQGLQSQSNTQGLSQELRSKEEEIRRLENLLGQVDAAIEKHLTTLGSVANDIRIALQTYPEEDYQITTSNIRVKVALAENLLFKKGSTTGPSPQADDLLASISTVIQRYPSMNLTITGHTDNKPPRNKGYKDNWTVSAIRAAIITRLLVKDHDLSPTQLLAAGKGEFAPRASNETADGRNNNRRIELIIQPRGEDFTRVLKEITKQK